MQIALSGVVAGVLGCVKSFSCQTQFLLNYFVVGVLTITYMAFFALFAPDNRLTCGWGFDNNFKRWYIFEEILQWVVFKQVRRMPSIV